MIAAFNWDLVVVAAVTGIPATLAAFFSRRSQLHTRSTNGGTGVNDDIAHLTENFDGFKDEVRDQWKFHLGFHHADRDIATQAETRYAQAADWNLTHGGGED